MKARRIAFECVGCAREIRVSRDLAGCEGNCPRCGLPAVVPTTDSLEAEIACMASSLLPPLTRAARLGLTFRRAACIALGVDPREVPRDARTRSLLRERIMFVGIGLTSALLVGAMVAIGTA